MIWAGFGAMIFATVMGQFVIRAPVDPQEPYNQVIQPAIGAGDFANCYVMAKMKLLTQGRYLWMRTIGSTIVGQAVDSAIFYPIARSSGSGSPVRCSA